ncbi:MAG: hypothetical protein GC201_00940 [Alphaproteobacteria bacterium]|nr:hypothetical protein [Alphaproteobacteria bacterium]
MAEAIAKHVDDIDVDGVPPGAFEFYVTAEHDPAGMVYLCPCGCGRKGALEFRLPGAGRPSWIWDGDRERPTLTPSVHHLIGGKTHWHGHLTAGVWEPC